MSDKQDDQHQKVQKFRQGDVEALPAGTAHWTYNEDESPLVVVGQIEEGSEPQEKE
jgi:quercetin dioxygenase-like cupin family protein